MSALAVAFVAAVVGAPAPDEVDHLELAAVLVRDGHHERAARELAAIDPEAPDTPGQAPLDRPRYWTLRGVVALQRLAAEPGAPAATTHLEIVESFERARELGATDPMLPTFIAQSYAALGQWEAALAAFDAVRPELLLAEPRLGLLRADAAWKAGRAAQAHAWLRALVHERPELADAWRLLLHVLVQSGLHHEAAEVATAWLASRHTAKDDHLAAADALRRAGALPEAEAVATDAAIRHPHDADALALLGLVLLERGQALSAALVLERVAMIDPARALDAAELYRRAGQPERAAWLNARVPDPAAKLRQRVGLLVDLGRFEEVAAMGDRVRRLGLDRDDALLYALAFASFRVGDHAAAGRWLDGIRSPEVFEKAAGLRKTMTVCAASPESCR